MTQLDRLSSKTKIVLIVIFVIITGFVMLFVLPKTTADAGTTCCAACPSGQPHVGPCYCNNNDANVFDKCPGGQGCGCCGSNCGGGGGPPPPPPCNTSNPAAAVLQTPANGSFVTNPVTFTWQQGGGWGNGCPDSGRHYRFYYKVKQGANCNAGSWIRVTPNIGSSTTTTTQSIFTYGETYCWMIQKRNNNQSRNSAAFEFTVLDPAVLVDSGVLNANACSTPSSGREVHPNTNNPITFYMDYQDTRSNFGSGVNRFSGGRIAIIPSDFQSANAVDFNVMDPDILVRQTAGFGVDLTNINAPVFFSVDNPTNRVTSGDLNTGSGTATLLAINNPGNPRSTRVQVLNNTTVRIYWEIRFNDNFTSEDMYFYTAGVLTDQGVTFSDGASGTSLLRYSRNRTWKTDLEDPILNIDTTPTSVNRFNITWDFNATDATLAPGNPGVPRILKSYCYTTSGTLSIFNDTLGGQRIDLNDQLPDFGQPGNCLVTEANWGTHLYRVSDLNSLADLQFWEYAEDAACNVADVPGGLDSPTPWLITSRSSVSAGGGFSGFRVRNLDLTDIVPNHSLDSYLSSYSAIAGTDRLVSGRESKADFFATTYNDLSLLPPDIASEDNWYDYLHNLVASNFTITEQQTTIIDGPVSTVLGVDAGSPVFVQYPNDLRVSTGAECDVRAAIFVTGDLTISPNFRRVLDNGCVFIVQGDILINSGNRTNPASKSFNETAGYDIVEAFLVTNGTYTTQSDQFNSNEVPDGLILRGGMFAGSVDLGRSLGLSHNSLQPAEVFEYDPFYESTFRSIFATRTFSLRAKQ